MDEIGDLLLDVGKEGLSRATNALGRMCEDDIGVYAGQGVLGRPGQLLGRLVVGGHCGHEGHAATSGSERQGFIAECAVEKVEFAAELGQRSHWDVVAKGAPMDAIGHIVFFV